MELNDRKYNYPIYFCSDVAKMSTEFEKENTEIKRKYLIRNIKKISDIMQSIKGCKGTFGTGYPFYVLDSNLEGNLPIIEEQINYNKRLMDNAVSSKYDTWTCADCLEQNGYLMDNLKVLCKPCPRMDNELKPRKVINRLPDIDMWMICEDDLVDYAKLMLPKLFNKENMHSSDIDIVGTIKEFRDITLDLKEGTIPSKYLPLDVHIIEYSKFKRILENTPLFIINRFCPQEVPYMPIHPYSLRKEWQKDDEAYNFILDFIYSLTPFNWDNELMELLNRDYNLMSSMFENDKIEELFLSIAPDSVKRRYKTGHLQKCLKKRIENWK